MLRYRLLNRTFNGVLAAMTGFVLCSIGPASSAELIQNGSFEEGLAGWSETGYNATLGSSGNPIGTEGNRAANIGAFDAANSSISQEVFLDSPGLYKLDFDWLLNGNAMPGITGSFIVTVDLLPGGRIGELERSGETGDFALSGALGFQHEELSFNVENADTTIRLSFVDTSPNGGDNVDIAIDDVRLSAVSDGTIIEIVPAAGNYFDSVEVSITNHQAAGEVRYTTDGSEPQVDSTLYAGPFVLTESATVRARLFINGFVASEIVSADYVISALPDIEFLPAGGLFTNAVDVVLVNNVGTGTIRYTTDGSVPTGASAGYADPIELTAAATIRAMVFFNGFPISEEFSESYARVYAFEDDGVSFEWREQYFGAGFLTNPDAAADADPDGDNYTNREEFEQGTIPTDETSLPEIDLGIALVPKLEFNTVPGKTYQVLRKESVNDPEWTVLVPPFVAEATIVTLVDEEAPATAIYQIELVVDAGE